MLHKSVFRCNISGFVKVLLLLIRYIIRCLLEYCKLFSG